MRILSYVTLLIVILLAVAFIYDRYKLVWLVGNLTGRATARYDLLLDRYELYGCDLGDCFGQYQNLDDPVLIEEDRILWEKYRIKSRRICGPSIASGAALNQGFKDGFSWGHHDISYFAIINRHGENFFDRVKKEAILEVLRKGSISQTEREQLQTKLRYLQ